jgi:hypothetical protein
MSAGPIFALRIRGRQGQAGIHALRAVLKELLRRHHFVCIDAREEHDPAAGDVINTEKSPGAEAQHRVINHAPF